MKSPCDFTTPHEALREMRAAGAVFDVRRRDNALGFSFTYRVAAGGDASVCRDILAAVKARPPIFFEAFRAAVQASAVEDVATSSTRPGTKGVVSTTPFTALRAAGGRLTKVVATTLVVARGDVETSLYRSEEGVSAPSMNGRVEGHACPPKASIRGAA